MSYDRTPRILRLAATIAVLSCLMAPYAGAQWAKTKWVASGPYDDGWMWGNLTWQEGQGGIVWGPAPHPPAAAGHGQKPAQGGELPAPEVFESEPLPRSLYLNASRNIEVDLLFKRRASGGPLNLCEQKGYWGIEIRLSYAGQRLAGAFWDPGQTQLRQPAADFYFCRYRAASEVGYLAAGTKLRLEIIYTLSSSETPFEYGVGRDTESVLRIPVLRPEEAFYRVPEIIPRARTLADAATGSPGGFLPTVFGMGAFALSRSTRSGRAKLVLATVCLTGLSGCLGGSAETTRAPDDQPPAQTRYFDPGDTGLADGTHGSIIGQAWDPGQIPVRGAKVALLGTAHFAHTDGYGIFSFRKVAPGLYTLRMDHDDYLTREVPVEVKAGFVVTVDVELAYRVGLAADLRPHRHDYWNGARSHVVYDGPLHATCSTLDCQEVAAFFVPPKAAGDWNIIRPGTVEVEVNATWDPVRLKAARLGLMVQANHDRNANNRTYYMPRGPNEPYRIRATWEMTDAGHQSFSTWSFGFLVRPEDKRPTLEDKLDEKPLTGLLIDRVVITIHRGSLPLERPHPDHWSGRDELVLRKTGWGYFFGGPLLGPAVVKSVACREPMSDYVTLVPDRIVPPGATTVTVLGELNRAPGANGTRSYGWNLLYRTGNEPPVTYRPTADTHRVAPAPQIDGRFMKWILPVGENEADGTYNARSAWHFVMRPDDWEAWCMDLFLNGSLYARWSATVRRASE